MNRPVVKVLLSNIRNQRIVRIRIRQKRADRQKDFGDGKSRAPVIFQNIQANSSGAANIAVINFGSKGYFRRLEGIIL